MQIQQIRKRSVVYFMVGVLNTLVDYCVYLILRSTVLTQDNQIALAGIISGGFAMIGAFTAHGLITWRGSHLTYKTALTFFGVTALGLWGLRPILLTVFIQLSWLYEFMYTINERLSLPFSYQFIADTGAFGLMAALLLFYNYYMYGRYVFKKKS